MTPSVVFTKPYIVMFLTKLTRMALLAAFLILTLASCYWSGPPAKERDFGAADLFLPLDLFPENWQEVGEVRPMGPDSSIGIGDPDDAYLSYKIQQAPNNMAYYFVYRNDSERLAKLWFDRTFQNEFNNERVSIKEPFHKPDELSYRSIYAEQFHVACAMRVVVEHIFVCEVIAQYEEFGVDFHSVIRDNTLSLEEFNTIVCYIDALFVARLGLSEEPIDCEMALSEQALLVLDLNN